MERAVLGEQDHAAVLAFGGDLVAEAIRESFRECPDRGVAGDVLRLEPQSDIADEAVYFELDEHRLPESVKVGVLILPTPDTSFHQPMTDYGPGRQRLKVAQC